MASNKKKKYKPTNRPKNTANKKNLSTAKQQQAEQKPPEPKDRDTIGKGRVWIAIVLVAIASLVAYSSAFDNQLTNWDDNFYVNDNPVIRDLSGKTVSEIFFSKNKEVRYHMGNYHPLAMLSLNIDYQIGKIVTGKEEIVSWPYISTNVVFHVLNTLLVFLLIYLLWGRVDFALIAALLFGVHAIHVESVAWISERKDVLYTFFFLLSLIAYIRYIAEEKAKWLVLSLLAFAFSLLSKGQAVSLAPTIVLIDWFRNRKLLSLKVILEKVPFFILGLVFGLIAIEAQKHGQAIHRIGEYPYFIRVLFACLGFSQYLFKLVIPHDLAPIYPYPILKEMKPTMSMWLHMVSTLGILSFGVWAFRKKYRNLTFGLAFFLVNIVLLLQLIPVGSAVMADRYSYIPSIGIHAIMAIGFIALYEKFKLPIKVAYGLVAVYVVALGVYTFQQIDHWQDSMAVWNQTLRVSPKSIVAWNNRGSLKEKNAKEGEEVKNPQLMQAAILDFNEALKIKPDYTTALYNRGVAFHDLKQFDKAMADFNEAIKFDPTMGDAYHNRGLVKDKLGKFQEAIKDFNRAVQFKPQEQKVYVNRGVAYGKMGNFPEAIKNFNKALEIDPNSASAYSNRGLANDHSKNYDQALKDYGKAIQLDRKFITAYMNRSLIYQKQRKWKLALNDLNTSIQFNPNLPNAYYQRANVYFNLQRLDLACQDWNKAKQMGMNGVDGRIQQFCKNN